MIKSTRMPRLPGVTIRYVFALLLVGLLSLADYFVIENQITDSHTSVAFVEASNHLETLMLNTAWTVQLLIDSPSGPIRDKQRADLVRLVSEIESSLPQVLKPGIDPSRAASLKRYTNEIAAHGAALARASDDALGPTNPDYLAIRPIVSDSDLLSELHTLTAEYVTYRNASDRRLERLSDWDLYATAGVLLGTALFVFRPMKRRIQNEIAKLQEAEAYNRAIVDTAADGIITINSEGVIKSVNQAAETTFGVSADAMKGRIASDFLPWPDPVAAPDNLIRETEGTRPDGSRFPMEMAVSAMTPGRHPVHVVVMRDVTERKKLEQAMIQAERLSVVGTMSAKVAHEIRNPLGSITLNLDLVRKEIQKLAAHNRPQQAESHALLDDIRDEVRRIQTVVEEYLRFARMPNLVRQPLHLNEFLDQKLAFMGAAFDQAGVTCQTAFDPHLTTISADAAQLWQAVLNLVQNSIDAMPGGGTLTVGTRNEGHLAALFVSDTGQGIPPSQTAHLFEPFVSTKPQGTGLGLAMTQQIIAEHGGHITCTSEIDKGTTFTIYLPLRNNA